MGERIEPRRNEIDTLKVVLLAVFHIILDSWCK